MPASKGSVVEMKRFKIDSSVADGVTVRTADNEDGIAALYLIEYSHAELA